MANVYIMCGPAGSGKSTWLKNHADLNKARIVSRDQIRFSLLAPGEHYFSREGEVKKIFWQKITQNLNEGWDVFVDQTSLTRKSRRYLLDNISGYEKAIVVWIDVPRDKAITQNENRKGRNDHSYVPPEVISEMYDQFQEPQLDEGFSRIFRVRGDVIEMKGEIE